MSARHREPVSPAQARIRTLVLGLAVVFLVVFLFLRGEGRGGPSDETTPVAGETTTTAPGENPGTGDGATSTTLPGGTTTPGETTPTGDLDPLQGVKLDIVFDGSKEGGHPIGLHQPVAMASPPGDSRMFVVQRIGIIRILDENYELSDPAFLTLTDRVLANGIEQGLLGLAFHPDYANNGRFFVYYTGQGGTRQLSEFKVSATNPDRADPDSERVLFKHNQPEGSTDIRHYGGQLAFGPDGYLWSSQGDGADSRDQGQDPNTMFGAVSRLDVDSGDPYGIPADNPFVGGGGAAEVWAYGLRNPWRFSIDTVDGLIYIADVGHADQEEVNVVPIGEGGGYNFGWSDVEGTRCFHVQDCDLSLYDAPAITYLHGGEENQGCSLTGGYVYRGDEIPELHGTYFYTDWCSQWIKSFKFVNGQVTEEKDWTADLGGPIGQINTFGVRGSDGALFVATHDGKVAKFSAVR